MKPFKKFVHDRKKERRRKNETLSQRHYFEKRLEKFTIFYFVEGAPATNNLLENYHPPALKHAEKNN